MRQVVAGAALVAVVGVLGSGCGGSSSTAKTALPAASPTSVAATTSPVVLTGCAPSVVGTHYSIDQAHTGTLTAHTYSQSADVQAALEYDQLQSGARRVYLRRAGGRAIDGVASCVAMRFASSHLAGRFFLSYQALRRGAGPIVRKLPTVRSVPGAQGMTAYLEREQSFRGYHIASTDVVELAGQSGSTLYIASVASAEPSVAMTRSLLESMVSPT
jgi:hypothetical protein